MIEKKQLEKDALDLIRVGTLTGDNEALVLGEKLMVALAER